jgi:uncharacterized protein with PQ loop repeat|tara:strand:- start:486 stop:803 length:318 start_codon:yes stop_codon:yes gene_type:complete
MKMEKDWLLRCLGTLAVIVTISGNIPQIIKIYKTKKTEDISTSGLVLKMIGKIMMLIYACYFHLWELFAPHIISFLLTTIILVQKFYYKETQNNFIPLDHQDMRL